MKKLVCFALVLVLLFAFASNAFAFQGTVNVKTWLNLRRGPGDNYTTRGYMRNGTIVTVLDTMNLTNGYYHIRGYYYEHHAPKNDLNNDSLWTGRTLGEGYAYHSYLINIG